MFVAGPLPPYSWLQPDRAVDPEASELVVPSDPVQVGVTTEFTVRTKDQDGKLVFVESMKVGGGKRGRGGGVCSLVEFWEACERN